MAVFSVGFLTRRPAGVNTKLSRSDAQPPNFIQDVQRFQLPSEEVPDEGGEEPPTLVGGSSLIAKYGKRAWNDENTKLLVFQTISG